ncbi:hypothetical protein HanHA300_Chr05g0167241 [Helianthus annuus]|nr:hypothetical protein HanHA300_Chr05g0167241 [Helianthus annuus]KAJ0583841.1 hypothetical protein HanHA89_Chr05g0181291 [Helianthus annuus]
MLRRLSGVDNLPWPSNCTGSYVQPQHIMLWWHFLKRISTSSSFWSILPPLNRPHLSLSLSTYGSGT